MAQEGLAQRGFSPRRVFGFASNQAFVFFLFYLGINHANVGGDAFLNRADLLFTLVFMAVGFLVLARLSADARTKAFARPLLYVYAVVAAAGSLVFVAFPQPSLLEMAGEGLLVGVPLALLLAAWGRTFGPMPTAVCVPEVFLGSLVGALVCLAFSLVPTSDVALLAFRLLPFASVVNIDVPEDGQPSKLASLQGGQEVAQALTAKVLAGTVLFGMAAGLVETNGVSPGEMAVPYCATSFVLFGAFLVGSLSLLLSDGFGRGAALNKSYRLAIFLMVAGALIAPIPQLAQSMMPGESIVLAGYLGLETVLVSLFLVMAKIMVVDAAHAFARGLLALFSGEIVGVFVANGLELNWGFDQVFYVIVALAGIIALLSYVFLFTERDFDALSQIVSVNDEFEETCSAMVERFKLSNREAEILPFAVRGRTGERIAQELVITKSTVDTHLRRIYAKCGVHSRQELIDLFESCKK